MQQQPLPNVRRWSAVGLVASLLVILGACASTPPPPTSQLDAARTAIATAERTNAGRFAGGELAEARDRLAKAETAVVAKEMVPAAQLADEARVAAELAAARTEALKAADINRQLDRGTEVLTEELDRAGDTQ